jgi:hypothetical protein
MIVVGKNKLYGRTLSRNIGGFLFYEVFILKTIHGR